MPGERIRCLFEGGPESSWLLAVLGSEHAAAAELAVEAKWHCYENLEAEFAVDK